MKPDAGQGQPVDVPNFREVPLRMVPQTNLGPRKIWEDWALFPLHWRVEHLHLEVSLVIQWGNEFIIRNETYSWGLFFLMDPIKFLGNDSVSSW